MGVIIYDPGVRGAFGCSRAFPSFSGLRVISVQRLAACVLDLQGRHEYPDGHLNSPTYATWDSPYLTRPP